MITVTVLPKNLLNQDPLQLQIQSTSNLKQLYDISHEYLQETLDQMGQSWPQFGQVAIYLDTAYSNKLNPMDTLQDILQNSESKIVILFPIKGLPIIEISINQKSYYYIENYAKPWPLYKVLDTQDPYRSIVKNNRFEEITINGKAINYTQEQNKEIKNYLEGHSNSIVTIFIKTKEQSQPQQKEEIKSSSANSVPKQEQAVHQPIKSSEQVKVVQVKPPIAQQNKKEGEKQAKQGNKQNQIQVIVKFQAFSGGYTGRQEHSLLTENTSTLLALLPKIVPQLKNKGFDWIEEEYEYKRDCNKLNIVLENHRFTKIDKPFKSLNIHKQVVFTFERHYDGGHQ